MTYSQLITFISCDIGNPTDLEDLSLFLVNQNKPINLLILNSGICEYLDKDKFNTEIFRRTFEINFFGLIKCLEICLPFLKIANDPQVAIMSSTVAYFGLPRAEAYGSSKSALRYLGQSLQVHWHKSIDISIICPGFVKTPLTDKNDFPMPMIVTSDWSAKYIKKKLDKRKLEISFPFMFVLILKLISILPDRLRTSLLTNLVKNK
jgi:short-subunit dehydrogenase